MVKPPGVLVVEDDVHIQHMMEGCLAKGGFAPAAVSSAEQAITLLQADKSYRALVMSINVRGAADAWGAARRARQINSDLPIVYMAAEACSEWPAQGVPNSVLLQKPFAAAQVVTAVSQLLNGSVSVRPSKAVAGPAEVVGSGRR